MYLLRHAHALSYACTYSAAIQKNVAYLCLQCMCNSMYSIWLAREIILSVAYYQQHNMITKLPC